MGGFLGALGRGLQGYARYRAMQSPMGRAIAGVNVYRQRHQQTDPSNQMDRSPVPEQPPAYNDSLGGMNAPMTDAAAQATDEVQQNQNGSDDLASLYPQPADKGVLITKPTVVMLAEHGQPERVVPLNANPQNRTSMPAYRGRMR